MQNNKGQSFLMRAILLLFLLSIAVTGVLFIKTETDQVEQDFGPAADELGQWAELQLTFDLAMNGGSLLEVGKLPGSEIAFNIEQGESVDSIINRLAQLGLVSKPSTLRSYLLYSGLDRQIRSGEFKIDGAQSPLEIAGDLLTPNPGKLTLIVFPGWRLEEVAAHLESEAFTITPQEFLSGAQASSDDFQILAGLPAGQSLEGYFLAGTYVFERDVTIQEVVSQLLSETSQKITTDMQLAFAEQGLNLHEALTLASIVERETIVDEEMPRIASVFLNRLELGMRLEADPTVQYALGYDEGSQSWWTNPLSGPDLQVQSIYNTYQVGELPPGPIAAPSLLALEAVANPEVTDFLFFQAVCDLSGLHVFALSYEEHLQNNCP